MDFILQKARYDMQYSRKNKAKLKSSNLSLYRILTFMLQDCHTRLRLGSKDPTQFVWYCMQAFQLSPYWQYLTGSTNKYFLQKKIFFTAIPLNQISITLEDRIIAILHQMIIVWYNCCQRRHFQEKVSQNPCFVLVHSCLAKYSSLGEEN